MLRQKVMMEAVMGVVLVSVMPNSLKRSRVGTRLVPQRLASHG
jgi:hypothetical protein